MIIYTNRLKLSHTCIKTYQISRFYTDHFTISTNPLPSQHGQEKESAKN